MCVPFGLQLPHAFDHINHSRNRGENSRDGYDEPQGQKAQLQHDPPDRAHLTNCRHLASPARFHLHFVADEIMQDGCAHQNDRIACDNENGKPGWEPSILGIHLAPVADAQSNDPAQEQTFVRDRVEDSAECAALFVATRHVSVETVARGREQENSNGGRHSRKE